MKSQTILSSILFLLLVAGCQTMKLVRDPAPAAIDVDYPTLEVAVCGQRALGLNGCIAEVGSSVKDLALEVVTVGSRGEVHVFSSKCGVDAAFVYSNGEQAVGAYSIELEKLIGSKVSTKHNCLLTLTTFPTYKGQENSGVTVRGFRGYVYLRAVKNAKPGVVSSNGKQYVGVAGAKLRSKQLVLLEDDALPLSFGLNGSKKGQIRIDRCRGLPPITKRYDGLETVDFEWAEVLGKDEYAPEDSCILQVRAVPEDQPVDIAWTIQVRVFDTDAAKLPIPSMERKDDHLYFIGSEFVSLSGANLKWWNKNEFDFEAKPGTVYLIRQWTVQGRAVLGKYIDGVLEWEN